MMVAKHYLIAQHDAGASEVERKLDRFFNLTRSDTDRQEPGYRQVLVATATPQPDALAAIDARYPPVPAGATDNLQRMELVQLLLRLFDLQVANHEDARLREQLEHRDRHIAGLQEQAAIAASVPRLNDEIWTLRLQLQAMTTDRDRLSGEVSHLGAALEQEMAAAQERHQFIARLQADLEQKNQHILYLEQLLQKIESGRVLRMTRNVNRLLGR
jgi:hypothetical protein